MKRLLISFAVLTGFFVCCMASFKYTITFTDVKGNEFNVADVSISTDNARLQVVDAAVVVNAKLTKNQLILALTDSLRKNVIFSDSEAIIVENLSRINAMTSALTRFATDRRSINKQK